MHSTNEATSLVIRKCIARPYCFRRAICRTWSYSLSRALHDCISSSIKFKTADGYAFLCTRLQRWKRLIWNFHKSIPLLFKTFKIFVGLWPSSFINWTFCCHFNFQSRGTGLSSHRAGSHRTGFLSCGMGELSHGIVIPPRRIEILSCAGLLTCQWAVL